MAETKKLKIVRIFCNECLREMKHLVLSSVEKSGVHEEAPNFSISWKKIYQVLECQECSNVTLRVRHWNDEAQWSHDQMDYQNSYYPPIVSRPKPVWFEILNSGRIPGTVYIINRPF